MRNLLVLVVVAAFSIGELASGSTSVPSLAQTQNSAQEKATSLRAQLSEVETKQAELQSRLQRLDESMKPENIEQNLAGIGSTKPEDLREQRRRQLEIERNGVQRQIDLLATSHTRLETAIAQADAEAYRQSAAPVSAPDAKGPSTSVLTPSSETTTEVSIPVRPRRSRKKKTKRNKRSHHAQTASPRPAF